MRVSKKLMAKMLVVLECKITQKVNSLWKLSKLLTGVVDGMYTDYAYECRINVMN